MTKLTSEIAAPAPTCSNFVASPSSITTGTPTTLSWTTTNAETVTIDNGVGTVIGNSVKVSPVLNTTYKLTATNKNGVSVTCTAPAVVVYPAPTCSNFVASATSITAGSPITLSWKTTNGQTKSIDNGVGVVTGSSTTVTPTKTTTYKLTVTNTSGTSVTCTAPQVTVYAAPVCSAFTATPTAVYAGSPSTLSWQSTGATSASIDNGVGAVATSGTSVVYPTKTSTYTLTLKNTPGTSVSCVAPTVTVKAPLPVCNSFTATPSTVTAGSATSLLWLTTNATKVTISGLGGTIPVSGSTSTKLTVNTTYLLTAYNADNATTSCAVTVIATPAAPDLSFCDAKLTMSAGTLCAVAPSKTDSRILDNSLPTGSTKISKAQDAHYGFGYHVIAVPKDTAHIKGTWIHFSGSYGRAYDQNSLATNTIDKYATNQWLNELMAQGYIVIQLAYDNRFSVNSDLCVASTSSKSPATGYYVDNCAGKVREMGLTGTGDGAGVRLDDQYNTIDYRIQALLTYLTAKKFTFPEKFDPLNFDWSKVHVSGHSQGANQSYYIAQKRKVAGSCMLAGAYDKADAVNTSPILLYNVADWILSSVGISKTPTSLQRATMTQTDDSYTSFYNTDNLILKLPATQLLVVPAATYHNSYGEVVDGHAAILVDPSLASYRAKACFQ
jgi:predicted cupin superfamily sugar epimerase